MCVIEIFPVEMHACMHALALREGRKRIEVVVGKNGPNKKESMGLGLH